MSELLRKITIILVVLAGMLPIYSQKYNFEDYVYPFGHRTFISQNSEGRATSFSQFSFASEYFDNYLIEEVYVGLGMMSEKNIYRYHTEENTVISDVQLRQNALTGSTNYQDKIVLFAFPNDGNPYMWSETDRGNKVSCKSEYVYISLQNERIKAIKITKVTTYTTDNVLHKVEEKSFWVNGFGRIITLGSWDGGKDVVVSKTDLDELLIESNFNLKE